MDLLEMVVDLHAIATNTEHVARSIAPAKLMAVVKANGYNHGAVQVATTMLEHGAAALGVATLAEAFELREAGIQADILCWIWSPEQDFAQALASRIDLAIVSVAHATALATYLHEHPQVQARGVIKVETGLHRSGVSWEDFSQVCTILADLENFEVTGLMSHFACADDLTDSTTDLQGAEFTRFISAAREAGLAVPQNHIANSAAGMSRPEYRHEMVRAGITLYGYEPIGGHTFGFIPAISWRSTVLVVKRVQKGEGVSYSFTWRAPEDGMYAVIPVGYADGLSRATQGHLEVTIDGQRYPQVGRVCMDQIVVWLGANPHQVSAGMPVVIFGQGGQSVAELAQRMGIIHYELVCRPAGRTVRRYVERH
ncbi:alanine racemase [Corynebacterium sp. HS2168-gen11]|uniref:alanine racemase n=1 Tax=Corynebacterium sp. HS2168-gen11 TaxID=2974027 RepID=UPI00216AE600|nr:alanine racemase [Corynebacterium sp. HS2168-gen11]MCS4535641.1 alanine racemase [Corynebacterium sp. HS2168-gen11]